MKWKRRGMVFMMNDFKAYLRYYVNSNKRLLILVFIILFLIMPFFTFNYMGLPRGPYSLDTFYTASLLWERQPVLEAVSCHICYQYIIFAICIRKEVMRCTSLYRYKESICFYTTISAGCLSYWSRC